MKKILIVLGLLGFCPAEAHGVCDAALTDVRPIYEWEDDCDACGCSANGGGLGYSSILDQNFVGIRYFYQYYKSKDGLYNDSPWIDEHFNTVQLWAKIPLSRRWQVSLLLPYQMHDSQKTSGAQKISGLGDVTVLGFYGLIKSDSDQMGFGQELQVGGGVKMPTGQYKADQNGSVNPSFQVGTGSWDFLLTAEYTLKYQNVGWQSMLSYTFKNENNQHYQFGNQWSYASTGFYRWVQGKTTWVPQLGIAGEVFASNLSYKEAVKDTRGDVLFGKLGAEVGYGRFSVGATALLPIAQNLTGGKVEAQSRWSVHLNYSL
ncbi:transporter [Flavobacterium sp. JP2137]|uniref:transporter n=1 Tax=Flavobacterium sp. JP2137 TaxID=3414510 RepID=UPI003D2FF68E